MHTILKASGIVGPFLMAGYAIFVWHYKFIVIHGHPGSYVHLLQVVFCMRMQSTTNYRKTTVIA